MKALVTGGAGFIGSHIAQALCAKGARVVVLDNLCLGSVENLAWKSQGDSLELVVGDVSDPAMIRKVMAGCDWVFHEAALPSVPVSVSKPLETNRDNLSSTLDMLVAARDLGVKRFMFASSSAVYGNNPAPAKSEDLSPDCLSPYALQKYASEQYARMFHQLYGLETVSFRYFNVFGPRQSFNSPYSGVIARFCTLALEGTPPTIFGDGLQSRDFVYIDNVVQANILGAERPSDKVAGQFFNVGGGESINLLQLVDELGKITGKPLHPKFEPARTGDVKHSLADISHARGGLAYNPAVSWQEGLKRTLEFYRSTPAV